MDRTPYLAAFSRPLPGRERDVHACWAERRELLLEGDASTGGLGALFGGAGRRRAQREQRLAEIEALLDEATAPVSDAFQGARVGLDPEADDWFVAHIVDDPSHERELRILLGEAGRPFDGPLSRAACVQRFVGAPLSALEGADTFASLRYALMYPRMEFRLTARWCGETFPRQRWNALQWPQDRWPEDGSLPQWVPPADGGLSLPLLPEVALQFADRFEAEILRALAPVAGLRGVPSRRLRAGARAVWRYAGAPEAPRAESGRGDDTPPTGLSDLPEATIRVLRFAADLFDQITWVRRWASAGHPLGIDQSERASAGEPETAPEAEHGDSEEPRSAREVTDVEIP